MSEFRTIRGFEEVWRPPVRPRHVRPETFPGASRDDIRARLARVARRVPEVMVKVTGRTRDPAHLAAHLTYITRNGDLAAEGRDGLTFEGRKEVLQLAADWSAEALMDSRRRSNTPLSIGLILSMPAGTEPFRLQDAARAFAQRSFGERFEYLLALHTDTPHPHVHLTVRALGDDGTRLNPKKADLEEWRQMFAECLRERGVDAEATPRRARGVTRKAERMRIRRLRERHELGRTVMGRVARDKLHQAAAIAFGGPVAPTAWEASLAERQARIRRLYLTQAKLLQSSFDPRDRALGAEVEGFVRSLQPPDTERLVLARRLRDANEQARRGRNVEHPGRDRR